MFEEEKPVGPWPVSKFFYDNLFPTSRSMVFWWVVVLLLHVTMYNKGKYAFKNRIFEQKQVYYGTVENLKLEDRYHKSKLSGFNNLLLIDFDSLGLQTIQVNDKTYLSTEHGERVGFYLNPYDYDERTKGFVAEMSAMILFIEIFIFGMIVIVIFFADVVPRFNALINGRK